MSENKSSRLYRDLIIIIITALITCILTTIAVYNSVKSASMYSENNTILGNIGNSLSSLFTTNKDENKSSDINAKLAEINQIIEKKYIGEVDEKKLIDGAIEGYVDALGDEYTEYLTEAEVNELKEEVDSAYVGIGVYISQLVKSNEIIVIGVIKDSPADKAGILAGDIIKKIDEKEYFGNELTVASNKMRGIEGTEVTITVKREESEMKFNIKREKIKIKHIASEVLENDIGYIQINAFEGNCAKEFREHYNQLQEKGIKSLIIDLRNNGGGLVDESLKIADYIVPKGKTTLITIDKNNTEELSKSTMDPIVKVPVAVLVNEYTASASEILTGALLDNECAKVVGTKTYGKGVIQGIYLLSDRKTAMKVTMQEYLTPNRNRINKTGITPEYEVELPEEWKGRSSVDREADTQLKKAIELLK